MSDQVSALHGAEYDGAVRVTEGGLRGMVTLKAELTAATAKAVKAVTGQGMPAARGINEGAVSVAWMAPDELLILCDHGRADQMVTDLSAALGTAHHLAVNVSDARALFTLEGSGDTIRDTLGKVTPADLSALKPGEMRRTRIAQIPAAIWFESATKAHVICFRSVARYAFDVLAMSARDGGEVGYH